LSAAVLSLTAGRANGMQHLQQRDCSLMHSVTLYHWEPNANSGKPMLALMEKGVAFKSHYLDLLSFDQHKPEYLAVNPQGTIPAMLHGERVLTESTAIMEYVDDVFEGPRLMPEEPRDRWRVRWWMKFMDQWLGPSFSMIGWSVFVGPAVRAKDPAELKAAIERIPLPERRVAWRKAIYAQFSAAEMQESQRRVALGIRVLEQELARRPWLASNQYSLADINGFNLAFALPLSQPKLSNDELTPNILRWLRAIYARPATKACWAMGRTNLAKRVTILEQPHIGQGQLA
jgi:GSH-dependent disulfide-bond oxidoreductase